jgi:acid phosphatase (class A)
MNSKFSGRDHGLRRSLVSFLLATALVALSAAQVWADGPYLTPGHPDGVALLAPPPVLGSDEEAADLATARMVFKSRTPELTKRAETSASLSLFNFAPIIGPEFKEGKFPKMEALFATVKTNIADYINIPKKHWKRLRPCQVDPELDGVGEKESSPSYPSGHSTRGTVQALMLAELFPEKREALLTFGRQIGWDRVLIGKHFPTDVQAGRVLGQAIMREMMANPAFQHDLAAAKEEVRGHLAETKANQGKAPQAEVGAATH